MSEAKMSLFDITKKKRNHQYLVVSLFLLPWLIGFSVFLAYPIFTALYTSFTRYRIIGPSVWIGLKNYAELLHDAVFIETLYNTLYFVFFIVPLNLVIALSLALVLNTKIRGNKIAMTVYFIPYVLPAVVIGMIYRYMLNADYGIVNYILSLVGVEGPPWLQSVTWIKPAIIFVSTLLIGEQMIIFLVGLQTIPQQLYDAAKVDGATWWDNIKHITLPLISPVILFNVIIQLIDIFQIFTLPFCISWAAGSSGAEFGGPGYSSTTYVMHIYREAFSGFRLGAASALSWVLFFIILGLTGFMFKLSRRWVFYYK